MTTSHRPQLEARNGSKGSYVPTSIEHARLLPSHTKLKYRKRKMHLSSERSRGNNNEENLKCVHENDRLLPKESGNLKENLVEEISSSDEEDRNYKKLNRGDNTLDLENNKSASDTVGSHSEDNILSSSPDEEGEEEEIEDEEALLRELNKIRQERLMKKMEEQQAKEDAEQEGDLSLKTKSDWRSRTAFGRRRRGNSSKRIEDDKSRYTSDLTKSQYHQEFLHKFVK